MIQIELLNIRSGRTVVLEVALRALQQVNIRIGVLKEMKLTRGIHTHYIAGYKVWAT